MKDFVLFSPIHFACLAVSLLLWVVVIRRARRVVGSAAEAAFTRRLGLFILVWSLAVQVRELLPSYYHVGKSWPLHLCSLAWIVAVWGLFSRRRLPRALIYFWGIGLSTQAFVTPNLSNNDGIVSWRFWTFWVMHWQVVGTALVEVIGLRFRPTWPDWRRTVIFSLSIFVLVTFFNLAAGTNYFFSGRSDPDQTTVIDYLGPWPWRLLWMVGLVIGVFALMTWPWTRRRSTSSPAPF